jgi:hypothetical protein
MDIRHVAAVLCVVDDVCRTPKSASAHEIVRILSRLHTVRVYDAAYTCHVRHALWLGREPDASARAARFEPTSTVVSVQGRGVWRTLSVVCSHLESFGCGESALVVF